MKISVSEDVSMNGAEFAAHFVFEGQKPKLPREAGEIVFAAMKGKEFEGKEGTQILARTKGGKCLVVGLGKKEEFEIDKARAASGRAAVIARDGGAKNMAFAACSEVEKKCGGAKEYARTVAEGALISLYKFDKYKSIDEEMPPKKLLGISIASANKSEAEKGIAYAEIVCGAAEFARDIGNESGEGASPIALAQKACAEGKKAGLKCRIIGEAEAKKLGMNLFLAVARGSEKKPAFVVMEYSPRGAKQTMCLVGKGVTFDSGGISLKPGREMDKMKHDKCGAATVYGAMIACAKLKVPMRVIGITPLVENMPSGKAVKPGDIVRALNGKSVEILNTDAEGRLILADALLFAQKYKPDAIIDFATLTGAVAIALGPHAAAVVGKSPWLVERLKNAGADTHERLWELPLWKEYSEAIKGEFADIKNMGDGDAGTITAAAFLSNFVGEYEWAHIDIAATAYTYKPRWCYFQLGATGFGVRMIARAISEWKGAPKKKNNSAQSEA